MNLFFDIFLGFTFMEKSVLYFNPGLRPILSL